MKMAHCEDMSDFEASESFHHDSKKQIPVALIIPTMHGLKSYWGGYSTKSINHGFLSKCCWTLRERTLPFVPSGVTLKHLGHSLLMTNVAKTLFHWLVGQY